MGKMDWKKLGLYALAGFGAYAVYNKYISQKTEEPHINASGKRYGSVQEVRNLQRKYPYKGNEDKPWWKCGCVGDEIGGCVGSVCIGPGIITIGI